MKTYIVHDVADHTFIGVDTTGRIRSAKPSEHNYVDVYCSDEGEVHLDVGTTRLRIDYTQLQTLYNVLRVAAREKTIDNVDLGCIDYG